MNRGIVVVNNKCTISRPVLSSLSRIPSRKSTRASNTPQTLTRFRCCTFLAVVCFTAATAFSTTFPLKSSSGKNPVNSHGLPSKQDSPSEGRGQLLQDETTKNNEILAKPTGSTNLIPPPELGDTSEEINTGEDYSEPLDDTEDEKDGEKMQAAVDYQFKERIQSSVRTVKNWENVEWLEACRKIIPWDELRNSTGPYSNPENDRLLADNSNALFLQRLCRWFPKFMTWVNAPPCVECGCKECEMKTVRGPETEEEKEGNAKRVEGRTLACLYRFSMIYLPELCSLRIYCESLLLSRMQGKYRILPSL